MNKTYGLLIDYEYCTHCGSCEVTCKEEHGYPVGKWGIRVHEDGPWPIDERTYNFNWIPMPTDLCDLCADRTSRGREPACVHHCLANIIRYGTVEELSALLVKKPKQYLVIPQYKPLEAAGPFVSKGKKRHEFTAQAAEGSGKAEFSTHRHDSRVGEFDFEE